MADRDPVEVLAEEFAQRYRRGERPSLDEYVQRYPQYAERLRRTFSVLLLMEDVAAEADEEAFGEELFAQTLCGRVLGDFRIIREIGRGGMGIVYEAEQVSLGRRVALKVLPPRIWLNLKYKKRFDREVRAAAQLHHTNIVPVFGVGEQDGLHYYVMQFIEGCTLADVLDRLRHLRDGQEPIPIDASALEHAFAALLDRKSSRTAGPKTEASPDEQLADAAPGEKAPAGASASRLPGTGSGREDQATRDTAVTRLSDTDSLAPRPAVPTCPSAMTDNYWQAVAQVGVQVASALQYAHSQGITHRDIKPANLLLDLRGTVWVADFGLAKSDDHEDVTHTGDIIGTLRYMAPETFDGHADPRSDIYSLGLTLYELLALRPAFDETERNRLMRQVLQTAPPPLRSLNPAIPRDLETIVLKAIDRDPARRYQTAGELMADLQRFLNDEPIRARRVTVFERLWRWCRRNPVVSWTALTASVAILTTAVTAFVLVTRERDNALRLAGQLEQQAKRMARLAEEKSRLAEQERQARMRAQQAKAATEAALAREAELRRQEQELRQAAEEARNRADQAAKEAEAVTNFLLLEMYSGVSLVRSPEHDLTVRGLLDRAAQRADKSLKDQPLQQAAVRAALGQAYRRLGLFEKAERQLRLALEARRRLLGPDHPVTLATANLRARVLYRQRKVSEAYQAAKEALHVLEESVGVEHPVTLTTMNTVALCLVAMRRFAEAQELCEKALTIQERLLGSEHADTLDTRNTLAITLYAQKQFQRARKVLAETLGILQRVYGPDHPNTLQAMANLAGSMLLQGDGAAAQDAYTECWELMKRVNGPDHPTTIAIEENLAVTMMVQKDFKQAESLLREALTLRQKANGPRHWRTLNTAGQLGVCLSQQRQFEEAEKLLLDSAETMMADPHAPPGFVRLALQRLVNLYQAWKKPDLARAWRSRLSQWRVQRIQTGVTD